MSRSTIFGKISSSEMTLHIDEVQKELHQTFTCGECGSELIPVKSVARKKDWHFRHTNESNLLVCRQRGLHDFAQQLLLESNEIQISKKLRINYSNPEKEMWLEKRYRSDVAVNYEENILHFEVYVTSDLGLDKINYYNENLIKCLKIDLSDKKYLTMSRESIADTVLNSIHNKTMYGWEIQLKREPVQERKLKIEPVKVGFWERYGFEIAISAILVFILFLMNRSMKKGRS